MKPQRLLRLFAALFFGCLFSHPILAQRYQIFPQTAAGSGWSFDVFVNNQSSLNANGLKLSFFNDAGDPLPLDTASGSVDHLDFSLAGGETRVVSASRNGPAVAGYALLRFPRDANIRASLILRFAQGGRVLTGVGLSQQSPFSSFSFPAEVNSSRGVNTGLALANPILDDSSAAQTVIVSLIDEQGGLDRMGALNLGAGAHTSLFLDDPSLFPGLGNFRGTVSVSSPLPHGLLALRLDQGILSSVAVNFGPVVAPFVTGVAAIQEEEPNDSNGTAQSLTLPAAVDGVIGSDQDVDYFSFEARAGDIVTIYVDGDSRGDLDSLLFLEGPDSQPIAVNDQCGLPVSNDSFIQMEIPQDGRYFVHLEEYFGAGGPNYRYRLHVTNGADGEPPPPGGNHNLAGNWSGTTGQGKSISFVVENDRITSLSFSATFQGMGCSANIDQTTQQLSIPIANNSFSYTHSGGPGAVSFTFSGSFSSDTAGSGNLNMTLNAIPGVPGCSGSAMTTWNATKGGAPPPPGGDGLNGTWAGTTGQGKSISFTVSENRIVSVSFMATIQGAGCSAEIEQTTQTSQPINNNSFSFTVNLGPGATSFQMSGSFASNTSASGNIQMTLNSIPGVPSCGGMLNTTWQATKQ